MILRHPGAIEGAELVNVVLCCVCARVCYDGNSKSHNYYHYYDEEVVDIMIGL